MVNTEEKIGIFITGFVIIVVLGIIVAMLGMDQVDASHYGVKVRFGEIKGTMEPGLKWTGMFTQVYEYDMRVREMKVELLGEQSATDNTGQKVFGVVSVNYRLKPDINVVQRLYKNVGRDRYVASKLLIEPIIIEGFKQSTVQFEAMDILKDRQAVKNMAKERIIANFPSEYFEITQIVVSNIDFTTDFKDAIELKKIATQERLKEEELVGVVKAQQEQNIIMYRAQAKKLELQKAQITDQLNTQAMIQKWTGVFPTTLIINGESASSNLLLSLATGSTATSEVLEVEEVEEVVEE